VCRILGWVVLATLPALVRAQRASSAGVAPLRAVASASAPIAASPPSSLARDVKHGAMIGGVTGVVLGLVGMAVYVRTDSHARCCEQPASRLRLTDVVTIEAASGAAGALVGALLGYSYHADRQQTSPARKGADGR